MSKNVLITLESEELESLIIRSVNTAIRLNEMGLEALKTQVSEKTPLKIEDVCQLTGLARSTIYYLAPKGLIPCHKKGRRLYFFHDELVAWLKSGRTKKEVKIG